MREELVSGHHFLYPVIINLDPTYFLCVALHLAVAAGNVSVIETLVYNIILHAVCLN